MFCVLHCKKTNTHTVSEHSSNRIITLSSLRVLWMRVLKTGKNHEWIEMNRVALCENRVAYSHEWWIQWGKKRCSYVRVCVRACKGTLFLLQATNLQATTTQSSALQLGCDVVVASYHNKRHQKHQPKKIYNTASTAAKYINRIVRVVRPLAMATVNGCFFSHVLCKVRTVCECLWRSYSIISRCTATSKWYIWFATFFFSYKFRLTISSMQFHFKVISKARRPTNRSNFIPFGLFIIFESVQSVACKQSKSIRALPFMRCAIDVAVEKYFTVQPQVI